MPSHSSILLIEDSPGECELFRLALKQTEIDIALYAQHDADAALHFLEDRYHQSSIQARSHASQEGSLNWSPIARVERTPPTISVSDSSRVSRSASTRDQSGLPSLILLDLQLRGQHGRDVLKRLHADARFRHIPVVIFTTSDDASDIAACYAEGANAYVVKPGTFEELVRCTERMCRFWLEMNLAPAGLVSP